MPKADPTVDELIATINHSNVPTVVSEGKGDLIVLRRIEDRFASTGLSVLPANGRDKVLKLFERRSEFNSGNLVVFIADRDTWVYLGIPKGLDDGVIFFTDGYSIENDMFRDGELDQLLLRDERATFDHDLDTFLHWYSVALARHLDDESHPIATSPTQILDIIPCIETHLALSPDEVLPSALFPELKANYVKLLRGKSLFAVLQRQFSKRQPKIAYSDNTLLDIGASRSGACLNRIETWLGDCLSSAGYTT